MRLTYVSRVYVTIVVGIRHDLRCLAKDRDSVGVETDALVAKLFVRYVALDLSASSTSTGAWGVLSPSETLGFASDGCGKGTVLQDREEGEDSGDLGREDHDFFLTRYRGYRIEGALLGST